MNKLALRPIRYASLSGGKDSLYMFGLLLQNPDKYPLDMVVHFELETDYPFVSKVISRIKKLCEQAHIEFRTIKPRHSWQELYEKYDMPTRKTRWCVSAYKLDCKRQLHAWLRSQSCRPVAYIGYTSTETRRFKYPIGNITEDQDQIYPLAIEGISEGFVLEWARQNPIFEGYYHFCSRQGCWLCPNINMMDLAYLCKYYPTKYDKLIELAKRYEMRFNRPWKSDWIDNIHRRVILKWVPKLNAMEDKQ